MTHPTDQQLLEAIAAHYEPERRWLEQQAAEAQALLAELAQLVRTDDEPCPPEGR